MFMGQASSDVLTPYEQQALQASCDLLIESLFDDLQNVKQPEDGAKTMLGIYLPERSLYTDTPGFLRKLAMCMMTVAWK